MMKDQKKNKKEDNEQGNDDRQDHTTILAPALFPRYLSLQPFRAASDGD
jgi:hypothetical protein